MADERADKTRFRRPISVSIRVKMVAILTLLILFLLGVAYVGVDRVATAQVEADLRHQLLTVARAAAAGIDGDLHRDLVAGDLPAGRPLDDPRYRQLVDWLVLVQSTHGRIPVGGGEDHRLYLYTYVAGADPPSIILIGSTGAVEPEPGGAIFRERLPHPSDTLLQGLHRPVARVDSVVRDRWGVWVTAAAPILDSAGQSVGAVGVDMRDTTVVALQNRIRVSLLPALAAAGVVLLVTALLATHYVSRPILQLTAAAERIAAGDRSGDPPLPPPRWIADEITTLTAAWQTMLARLREREERLAYSEERYRALLDSLPGPAFLCDQQGVMSYVAPQIEDLLGHSPQEWIGPDGRGWIRLLHPDNQAELQHMMGALETLSPVGAVEGRISRADGAYRWIEGRYARFPSEGDRWLYAGIILDIQARKEAEQRLLDYTNELQIANQELQEAQQQLVRSAQLASIGELAATVAHEINNPLAVVRGLAQILIAERTGDPDLREPLEQIAANTERMARTVRTLRSLGRPPADRLEPVLVNPVVADAVALMEAQLADHAIALHTDLAPDLPPIQGVAHQLGQVVINLLANSRDAILATGRPGSIAVRTRHDPNDGCVLLSVADSGAGIPPADQGHIFRPFFTTKPDGQGTGLGLSISYRIVQQFGGQISFASQPGAGTTFTVRLPVAELEEPA